MSMEIRREGIRNSEHILSEASGSRSREQVTITGGKYLPAQVLGCVDEADQIYTAHDPTASDGSEVAVAILRAKTDASAGDVSAVITARDSEVSRKLLSWKTGITETQLKAALVSLGKRGIITR